MASSSDKDDLSTKPSFTIRQSSDMSSASNSANTTAATLLEEGLSLQQLLPNPYTERDAQLRQAAFQQQLTRKRTLTESQPAAMDPAAQRQVDLSKAKLKATNRTSALLAGFAMVALVELDYHETPKPVLIVFGVTTTLLVSVHLLALMMSTCILPNIEAFSDTVDSPHIRLKWYINLSWIFSTCLGLILFLLEIAIVFWIKFGGINYYEAAYVTTAILVPVFILFLLLIYTFYKNLFHHEVDRLGGKLNDLQRFLALHDNEWPPNNGGVPSSTDDAQFTGVTVT